MKLFKWRLQHGAITGCYTEQVDDISVQVQLKTVKRITLRVCSPEGNVRLSAPLHTPQETIRALIVSRLTWIQKHQKRCRALGDASVPKGFVRFLGQDVPLATLCGHVDERLQRAALQARLRRELHDLLQGYLHVWQEKLGLQAASWHVRRMTSRWGSCNPTTARLCFNADLIRHAPECIEYVVVHELMHLRVHGHGKAFWHEMSLALPDWKTRRDVLNRRI